MPDLPNLTPEQVEQLISMASNIEFVASGGQKLVFRGVIGGESYALKFAKVPKPREQDDLEEVSVADVSVRAKREVETMRDCASPHMVKLGPVGLMFAEILGQSVLYFSEEFIVGRDLKTILRDDGFFPPEEIVKLGIHVTDAIKALWELGKIHRDIKPANIMRRDSNGDYVLLDAGLAFDIIGESVSVGPVGTPAYFSPEQFDFTNRRTVMDFRSDVFSLGVTMYQLGTGQHPFWTPGDTSHSLFSKIVGHTPAPPSRVVSDFPEELDDVILRMLGKSPHLRYRRCAQLIDALNKI